MADIFFLDLGIVIEPATGNESFSREIGKTSKEVQFRIKKVKSGSVYMAASQEMMDALTRIQERMDRLEQSFQHEMGSLNQENRLLRNTLSDIGVTRAQKKGEELKASPKEALVSVAQVPVAKEPVVIQPAKKKSKNIVAQPEKAVPAAPANTLNMIDYMGGLFAYEREDYKKAIKLFNGLSLEGAEVHMVENVLYWKADGYQHLGQLEQAMETLDQLLALENGARKDDALIKRGLLLRKQGLEEQALITFGRLIQNFPESEYARLAQLELNKAEKLQ